MASSSSPDTTHGGGGAASSGAPPSSRPSMEAELRDKADKVLRERDSRRDRDWLICSWESGACVRTMVGSAPEAKLAQYEHYVQELSKDGSVAGASATSTDGSGAVPTSSAAGHPSLDVAKSHAAEAMRGDVNQRTGGGDGSGGGGGRNAVADKIDVDASHILLSMRSGSAGDGSGVSSPTEVDDLMSTWSTSAPAVFPSLVSPVPEGDATAELLELMCQSGDSDYLLDAVYFGAPSPSQTMSGALEEGGGNPDGISAEMLQRWSGKILHCEAAGSSTACPAAATSSSGKASTVAFPDGDQTPLDCQCLLA